MFTARHSVFRRGGNYSVYRSVSASRFFSNTNPTNLFHCQNLTRSNSLLHQTVRNYRQDFKIKWVRPTKIPCYKPEKTGDLEQALPVNKSYPDEFMESEEFKSANDLVKRMFSLQFSPRRVSMSIAKNELVSRVQRHQQDYGSVESKLAKMTAGIRNMQLVMEEFPRNKRVKVKLKELIDRRKKILKYLRKWDYKRFEWLIEKLNLVYKPHPPQYHGVARKESMRKLTTKYCEDLKEERLAAYRAALEAQKIDFLREKLEKLQWMRKEEEECGVEPTVTKADIEKVALQLKDLEISREGEEKNPVQT